MSDLANWGGCSSPSLATTSGRFVRVERAEFPRDSEELFEATGGAPHAELWRYIPFGPFDSAEAMGAAMKFFEDDMGWQVHLFREPKTGELLGTSSYMRIRPEAGSAEVGCVVFSSKLKRTPAATEAMYLMARHLFEDLGYRRYEWKCNHRNEASGRAAERFGFTFEGVFRQDMVAKGENRDTAWYSMIDGEWPRLKKAFEIWLAPENFDEKQLQRRSLGEIRAGLPSTNR